MKINYSNVIEQWANYWPEVVRWLGKLQEKRKSSYYLNRFCQWASLNPKELLALKNDPSSKEAEKLLDTFVSQNIEGMTNATKFNIVIAVKSFFKHNYSDLARASGVIYLEKKKPYHKPTKEELRKLREWCFNPRDRSIISLAASTSIAKETIVNLKWGHLEDNWETQDIPHISVPPELIKGHGRGKYKGVRQETFLTPEAKKDLLTYREWIERKTSRKVTKEDHIYVDTRAPYNPLSYQRLGGIIWELSKRAGIPFSLHDCRRYVETALEEARIPPNWARKIRGRKVRGEEAPYSQPAIEQLRQFYREAAPKLQFLSETARPAVDELQIKFVMLKEEAKRQGLDPMQIFKMKRAENAPLAERYRILEEMTLKRGHVKREESTFPNGGNCNHQKIVSEDELPRYLSKGWWAVMTTPSGKIVIEEA